MRRALATLEALSRGLRERAKREPSSPSQIGSSVALGAFVAVTPFIGFHLALAFVLATLLRQNRIWAMLGSHLSPAPVWLAAAFAEIEAAHFLRTGAWAPMTIHDVGSRGRELLLDWLLGTVVLGVPLAVVTGLIAYVLARRWQSARATATQRTLATLPPPSSEFPPSAPRAPSG